MKRKTDTFENWRDKVTKMNPHAWQHVGDWFFPTPQNINPMWEGVFFHICEVNWKTDLQIDDYRSGNSRIKPCKSACYGCGVEIPDNIKMIAGLLTW